MVIRMYKTDTLNIIVQEPINVCELVGHRYGYDYPTGEFLNGYPIYAHTCQKCGDTQKFQSYTSSL